MLPAVVLSVANLWFRIPSKVEECLTISSIKVFYQRAGAKEISVAVNVVDTRDGRPEFMFACPWRRESCLLARVGPVPFVGRDLSRRVGRVLEHVILSILFSARD